MKEESFPEFSRKPVCRLLHTGFPLPCFLFFLKGRAADPLYDLYDRDIDRCKSVYRQKLTDIECLDFEYIMKRRYHNHSCDQNETQKKCSDQIYIIKYSSGKDYRSV